MQEQELFQHFELKGWRFSPRLYKIIGASALINVLAFFLMAQSNFLTGKTCDSPIASGVCSVLDALYVGSVIADTDPMYVDQDYQKTDLENSDITYVDVSKWQPLEYPAGYFAIANPETQMPEVIAGDPNGGTFPPSNGITPSDPTMGGSNPTLGGTGDLIKSKPILPKPYKQPSMRNFPKSSSKVLDTTTTSTENDPMKNESPNTLDTKTVAENKKDKTDETKPVENVSLEDVQKQINKKPLQDLANMVLAQWTAKEVDLSQQFIVVMNGALTEDGKLDPKKSIWSEKEIQGDPKIVEIAKEAIESVGDSGWLFYLRKFGIEKIKITLAQDNDKIVAFIESEQKTPERAKTLSSQINSAISVAKITLKGDDEKTLISGAESTSSGKVFRLNFVIPKPQAQEMIDRKLKEAQAKQAEQKTSDAQSVNANQTTTK